ncbi:TPA: glycosyltransferase family 39 protein, partial [Candidatus Galligastranaerophilus gallistercoris]|nr:glycosyltransferase family 39 protein [Candidatus Galligastranaerophilus gallistercoris]
MKVEFRNAGFINVLFIVLVLFTIISFGRVFTSHIKDFNIPILGQIDANLRINVEVPKNMISKIHIFFNGIEIEPYIMVTKNSYISYATDNNKVYDIKFRADDKKALESVKDIVITVGHRMFYYTNGDILKFKKDNKGNYIFPAEIRYYDGSSYITDKGPLKHFTTYFLSVFYNSKFYIVPIVLLFLSVFTYINNKDKINLGFNLFKNYAIWWIVFLGLLFRLSDNGFSFWSDELYTLTSAGYPYDSFAATFSDPGNPPLFFIFARFWTALFGMEESICRLLPLIFSTASIYAIYIFVKRNFDKNAALLSSFLFAVNLYSVYSAQEFRCYSLCALFSVLCAYLLFEIIKYKKNKDFVLYTFLSTLMANTHYFQILILISNFIIAMIFLDNKSRIKFFISNFIAFLSFLPYFFMTALNNALLNEEFNRLAVPDLSYMINVFSKFYTSKV